jgi:tetratricopeptide (TPR) repeat protein
MQTGRPFTKVDRMSRKSVALPCAIATRRHVMLLLCLSCAVLLHIPAAHADVIADCNQTDNPERAIRACSTYLEDRAATPQNLATAHVNRAIAYSLRRDFGQALSDYGAAIQLDPENPLPYYNRGNLYFDRGDHSKAIVDYTSAIERDASFALAYLNRGLAHERAGLNEAAAADYRQALSMQPTATQARRRLRQLRSKH